jgi:hypothetical protein
LVPDSLTEPLLKKTTNSKQIIVNAIETLKKERSKHATETEGIMAKVKLMIDEERVKADEKLACELAKADEKLACELAKADEKLACELAKADEKLARGLKEERVKADEKLAKANKRIDEMSFKLREVDAVTMETVEWISHGVCPGSNLNQHLPELTLAGYRITGSNQAAKSAQHRAGKTCFILPTYKHTRRCFTCLARAIGIHRRFRCQTCHRPSFTPETRPARRLYQAIS